MRNKKLIEKGLVRKNTLDVYEKRLDKKHEVLKKKAAQAIKEAKELLSLAF